MVAVPVGSTTSRPVGIRFDTETLRATEKMSGKKDDKNRHGSKRADLG